MAKDNERKTAHILYTRQGKTAREIAKLVRVSETTVSKWVNKYGWKQELTARITDRTKRVENIRQIISNFAEKRLELQKELDSSYDKKGNSERINEIHKETAQIDRGVANWNKTLEQVDKDSKITLGTYLHVMESIFKALQVFDIETYMKTITFQEEHINTKSIELG